MHQDMPTYQPIQPHATESLVQIIAIKLDGLHSDVSDLKEVLREMSQAVAKLAVIDERQSQASQSLERAFVAIEKVEARLGRLEQAAPLQKQTSRWVEMAVLGIVVIAVEYFFRKVGAS